MTGAGRPSTSRRAANGSASAKTAGGDLHETQQVNLGLLENYIGFHLRLAQQVSFRNFAARAEGTDLKPGWFAVLSIISANPGITPIALSRAAGRDKSTMTPVLSDLTRLKLVAKEARPADRRSYGLVLTDNGRERLAVLARQAAAHDRELDRIAGAMKPELLKLLRRISEELG